MTFKTILPDSDDLPVEVEYTYSRGLRGTRNRFGVPEEPDDEEAIEVESVRDANGHEIKLTTAQDFILERECWDDMRKRAERL